MAETLSRQKTNGNSWWKRYKKYSRLIFSVLFLVIFLVAVIVSNSILNSRFNTNYQRYTVINKQIALEDQFIIILGVIYHTQNSEIVRQFQDRAIATYDDMDKIYQKIVSGGTVKLAYPRQEDLFIPGPRNKEDLEYSKELVNKWRNYTFDAFPGLRDMLEHKVEGDYRPLVRAMLDKHILNWAKGYTYLIKIRDDLVNSEKKLAIYTFVLNRATIVVLILYLLWFAFSNIRKLRKSDDVIESTQKEMSDILETIQEGLFLIDDNLHIAQQTSGKLSSIIPGCVFSGQQLSNVLSNIIDIQKIESVQRFIKQLFNERIDEQLIKDLNPLLRIAIKSEDQGESSIRYVDFIFTRVWEDDSIKRVLVSIIDITESVKLEETLKKEREHNERHVELLMKILQISPALLASFLRNARQLTERINAVLRRHGANANDLKEKANEILRDVHGFKGEASALRLDSFVENCEAVESHLKNIRGKTKITGNDFMQVTISLNDLIDNIAAIENIVTNIQQVTQQGMSSDKQDLIEYYQNFAEEVGERNGKLVHCDVKEYDLDGLNDLQHDQIKEMIIQFIRNAVVHGIEMPSVRETNGKDKVGHLVISLTKEEKGYKLFFADDGEGINYDLLREKVKKVPQYLSQPELVDSLSEQELGRFIFITGVSTAKQTNIDAGRGVGMDVIKDKLRILKARIAFESKEKKGTVFSVQIPA